MACAAQINSISVLILHVFLHAGALRYAVVAVAGSIGQTAFILKQQVVVQPFGADKDSR